MLQQKWVHRLIVDFVVLHPLVCWPNNVIYNLWMIAAHKGNKEKVLLVDFPLANDFVTLRKAANNMLSTKNTKN